MLENITKHGQTYIKNSVKNSYFDLLFPMGKEKIPFLTPAFKLICNYYSFIKGIVFFVAIGCAKYFNKGYFIMKYVRK